MSRGKRTTPEEKLAKINEELEVMESAVEKLKYQKTELEEQIKQAKLAELYNLISASGKSFDEVKALIGVQSSRKATLLYL